MNLFKILKKYLDVRCRSGYTLKNTKLFLENFLLYIKSKKNCHIKTKLAFDFVTQNQNCTTYESARKLRKIRLFAIYLKTFDPKTEIPPKDLLPYKYNRRTPYIYTKKEINNLLLTCKNQSSRYPLHSFTHYTLFGLVAITGMRTSEVINLEHKCVDLDKGIITILESKFKKSRMIPIHQSTINSLQEYAKKRDYYFKKKTSPYFFVNNFGKKLEASSVRSVFNKVCQKIGLPISSKSFGPRIIDLRHTFAVNTIIRSYQKGLDVDTVIPVLSTYLGHVNPGNTYWYLTATPELLKLISNLVEKKFGGK